MSAWVTVEQCKRIVSNYMSHRGEGGFLTGTILSTGPLTIQTDNQLIIPEECLYVTDHCIGLVMHFEHTHEELMPKDLRNDVIIRQPLKPGEGVLLVCRPSTLADKGDKYIVIDRIRPYQVQREVDARIGGKDAE